MSVSAAAPAFYRRLHPLQQPRLHICLVARLPQLLLLAESSNTRWLLSMMTPPPRDRTPLRGTGPPAPALCGVAHSSADDNLVALFLRLGGRLQGLAVLYGAVLGHTLVLLLIQPPFGVTQDGPALQVHAACASQCRFLLVHADDTECDGGRDLRRLQLSEPFI